MRVLIGVDDVHPERGWGLLDDPAIDLMKKVNDKYGARFTFFVPSNYHGRFPISQYPEWMDGLRELGFIEFGAHGHLHDTKHKRNEAEFHEINTPNEAESRLERLLSEWAEIGEIPTVWKSPGWLISQSSADIVSRLFYIVHGHREHNADIAWNTSTIFGHYGIHEQSRPRIEGDVMIFQSHINGPNHNNWNQDNCDNLMKMLDMFQGFGNTEFINYIDLLSSFKQHAR